MSEPRIAIKVVQNHFVSCFPMPDPRPMDRTFFQSLRNYPKHRYTAPEDNFGLLEYATTRVENN